MSELNTPNLIEILPPIKDESNITQLAKDLMVAIMKDCQQSISSEMVRVQLDIKIGSTPDKIEKLREYMPRINGIMTKANMNMVDMVPVDKPIEIK